MIIQRKLTNMFSILVFSLTILIGGCAHSPKARSGEKGKPAWVDGNSPAYPKIMYITGVGRADVLASAQDKARAEVAKVIRAEVSQKSQTWERYIETRKGKSFTVEDNLKLEQLTQVTTEQTLEGVEIVQNWQDSTGMHYALAVLERDHAMAMLREKIGDLDKETKKLIELSEGSKTPLGKVKSYRQAIDNILLRDTFNQEFRVINPQGQGIPDAVDIIEVKTALDKVLTQEFSIGAEVDGEFAAELKAAIIEGLNRDGFITAKAGSEDTAQILVQGKAMLSEMDRGDPQWKYLAWNAEFQLIDRSIGNKVFGSVTKEGHEGHLTISGARQRVLLKLKKVVADEV
ncbi:MAG: LPP20 family lipoprotein, partial [Deltaproteobacteria bacterium]